MYHILQANSQLLVMKKIFLLKIQLLTKKLFENGIKKVNIQNINVLFVDKSHFGKVKSLLLYLTI
jgi:hypothetical protein